jgi:uncharacterized phage protein (TIGR02220 family)
MAEILKNLQVWINANTNSDGFVLAESLNNKLLSLVNCSSTAKDIDFGKLIIYYNKILNKSCRVISKKAKDNFTQRIKEGYLKQDIVKVIDNVSNDNFHKESNFKHVTLEFLSRPIIFERYSSMEHKKPISQIKDVFQNQ